MAQKIKLTLALTLVYALLTFATQSYAAACTGSVPVALGTCSNTGAWDYDTINNTYRYCNGTNYISMQEAGALSSCVGINHGTLDFDTTINNFKFCNGTDWISFSNDGDRGSCSKPGLIDYNISTNEIEFCNGTSLSGAIERIGDAGSISAPGTIWSWQTSGEYGSVDSGTYNQTKTLTVTNSGTCDLNITSITATPVNDCSTGPFLFCGGSTEGFSIKESSTCSGILLAGNTCNIEIIAQVIIPPGGTKNIVGTLTINTSTISNTSSLTISACDEVGFNAQNCS